MGGEGEEGWLSWVLAFSICFDAVAGKVADCEEVYSIVLMT